ncbi:MAG: hypothetical protein HY671_00040 [Chloroflexi bacterium]|nr:hypothetical protein [Chloroflexota bacterium]
MEHQETAHGTQAKSGSTPKCMACGADSQSRPLLSALVKGEAKWVCVRCLPMLIHG